MPEPTLIGLTGFAGAGKDHTAALLQSYLQTTHNITAPIVHFADPLKEITHHLFPTLSRDKTDLTVRKAYQEMGSLLRHHLSSEVFVNALHWEITQDEYPYFYIISDVRYPEEINYILNENERNQIIHVTRPGNEPPNLHISELAHTAIKLKTGRYINDRIRHYENSENNSPQELFYTTCNEALKGKP